MKPTLIYFLLLFCGLSTFAAVNNPILVPANEDTTVTFFFPENIMKVVTPASNYLFEYEENGTIGTLKAKKGAPSNLTVITMAGRIYSFLLRYEKEVVNFTYVLSPQESIGMIPTSHGKTRVMRAVSGAKEDELIQAKAFNTRENTGSDGEATTAEQTITMQVDSTNKDQANYIAAYPANSEEAKTGSNFVPKSGGLYEVDRNGYYDIFCENNFLQKGDFDAYGNTINRIGIQLNNIIADRNELYFFMEIQNTSWSDYTLRKLQFFVKTRELTTKLQVKELFTYNLPETVPEHSNHQLVFVCKKFKLAANQKVYVVLEEQEGRQRSVILPLEREGINRL